MYQVRYSRNSLYDLQRLYDFLRTKNPDAAKRARNHILQSLHILRNQPRVGRPLEDMPDEYREWFIDFGGSGYTVYYRVLEDSVTVLALRHQKEVGY
jgi:plasmid stabilization system protein ParE